MDKYSATWVSHSSISDFLKCPRAYFLKNVYKDPQTKRKMQLITPALALGSAVHEVIESLSVIPTNKRFRSPLTSLFAETWKKYQGKKGGFWDKTTEEKYYQRGLAMIQRVMDHPGPVARLAVKIKEDLPYYWISEEDNIILCGKIDWLEYLPDTDSVHIIDFKTSKNDHHQSSLQLPIYHLLVHNTQKRKVSQASYWYLDIEDELRPQELPELDQAHNHILEIAKKIKLQRKLNIFKCPQGENGCRECSPMEDIIQGKAELVGQNSYNQDVFIIPSKSTNQQQESDIL